MKRLFILIILSFFINIANAHDKQEKRVYYLDCSSTMVGSKRHTEDNIWEKVKENLKKAIDRVIDEKTELVVIPFAYNTLKTPELPLRGISAYATHEGKKSLKIFINNITTPNESKRKTMTYHKIPMDDFINYRIDVSKETYMFLLTDGKDEGNKKYFNDIVKNWNKYSKDDVYGIYVMLNPKHNDRERERIIKDAEYFWQVNTADLNINTIKIDKEVTYNIRDNSPVYVGYKGNIDALKFRASCNDPNVPFKIKGISKDCGKLKFDIIRNNNVDTLKLEDLTNYDFKIEILGGDEFTILLTPKIKISCLNKKEYSLFVNHDANYTTQNLTWYDRIKSIIGIKTDTTASFGTIEYYPSFLWSSDSTKSVTNKIKFEFSSDAKLKNDIYAEFQFVDNDGIPYEQDVLTIFDGDEPLNKNILRIDNNTEYKYVTFKFSPEASPKKYQGYFKLINHNLNRINSQKLTCNQEANIFQWTLHYKKTLNPLLISLILLLLLLSLIVFSIWLAFYIHKKNSPKFPKNWNITFEGGDNNIELLPDSKMPLYYNRKNVVNERSSTIYSDNLCKEHIKEIIIHQKRSGIIHDKWSGDTIYINSNFNDYKIDKISIVPQRGKQARINIHFEKETTTIYVKFKKNQNAGISEKYIIASNSNSKLNIYAYYAYTKKL